MTGTIPIAGLVEFIGTFVFLSVILTCVKASDVGPGMTPLAIGLALAVVIYFGGGISDGHFNPAVSIMFGISDGKWERYSVYIVAQILGGIAAYYFVRYGNTSYKIS